MRALLAAGLALLVLAGCGDSGDDKLSDTDFRAEANEVCVAYSQKVNALPDPGGYTDLAQYAASAHKALVAALDDLKALHPSDALEPDFKAWLASNARSLQRVDALEQAAKDKDDAEIQRLSAAANSEDVRADRIATRLGLAQCAND
jgi:hypothetical protein